MIQGNLKPNDKFLLSNPIETTWQVYGKPTFQDTSADLILWPENALPLQLPESQGFINRLDGLATYHNIALIIGLPVQATANNYYNSLLAVGDGQGLYRKKHLVPFGEYLPFNRWLRGLINFFDIPMSDFIKGPDDQDDFKIPNMRLLPLICYEIAYPNYVREQVQNKRAEAIITSTEDGWFGKSWGPHQHLQIAKMRALETGRYVLRSTTSGISAIIDHTGHIIKQSPQFKPFVLKGRFVDRTGLTPWVEFGLFPLFTLLCFLILLSLFMKIRKASSN